MDVNNRPGVHRDPGFALLELYDDALPEVYTHDAVTDDDLRRGDAEQWTNAFASREQAVAHRAVNDFGSDGFLGNPTGNCRVNQRLALGHVSRQVH